MEEFRQSYTRINEGLCNIHFSVVFGDNVRVGDHVMIDADCYIGDDSFIGHNCVLKNNIRIGNHSVFSHLSMCEAGAIIGNHVTIHAQCNITTGAIIEDHVFMGPMSMTINTHTISHGRSFAPKIEGPTIGYGSRIGSRAIIMPGVVIGREVVVGAGSIVTKNCEPFGVYIGSPALRIGEVPLKERL